MNRTALIAVGAALATTILHVVLRPDILATVGTLYDDVVYLSLGKAIAEGEGYRSVHLVGAPIHVKFPPLLPAAYAVYWRVTGSFEGAATGAYALSMMALSLGTWLLWRYGQQLGVRAWLLAFFVVGPLLLLRTVRYFAGAVSEPWLLAGWAAALVLTDRLRRKPRGRGAPALAIGLGLVLGLTTLARTQSVVLLPAVLVALAVSRCGVGSMVGVAAAALAPLIGWKVWNGRMAAAGPVATSLDQSPYLEWVLGGSVGETLRLQVWSARLNVPAYFEHLQAILVGWTSPKAGLLVSVALLVALVGLVRTWRSHPELALTLLATVCLLAFWPFNQARFLTTLLPVSGLAAAASVEGAVRNAGPVPRRLIAAGLLGVAGLLALRNLESRSAAYAYQASEGALPVAIGTASEWILARTAPEAHILADYSGVYYLRTGRQTSIGTPERPFTVPSVFEPAGPYLAERLLADSVDFVIDARPEEYRITPQVEAVRRRCPGVLLPEEPVPEAGSVAPRFWRVVRDERCLSMLAREAGPLEFRPPPR